MKVGDRVVGNPFKFPGATSRGTIVSIGFKPNLVKYVRVMWDGALTYLEYPERDIWLEPKFSLEQKVGIKGFSGSAVVVCVAPRPSGWVYLLSENPSYFAEDELELFVETTPDRLPCSCPMWGATGLLALGCRCGGI